jgi:hypothetical protein
MAISSVVMLQTLQHAEHKDTTVCGLQNFYFLLLFCRKFSVVSCQSGIARSVIKLILNVTYPAPASPRLPAAGAA